jgi:hypothetical protein
MDWFSWENLATGHVVGFFIELDDGKILTGKP